MADEGLHLLGIRHHGPGSAASVEAALDELTPEIVLIEGPPEANELLRYAVREEMRPPLALLVYATDEPALASFYPFAAYSPEWRAIHWALANGKRVRFIDLPATHELALTKAAREAAEAARSAEQGEAEKDEKNDRESTEESGEFAAGASAEDDDEEAAAGHVSCDPLGTLAKAAGYEDGEAWWNALIEQGAHGRGIFTAIERAMAALRETSGMQLRGTPGRREHEARREAHMRLAIREAMSEKSSNIAVVTGAWHVPALRAKVNVADDKALLKGLPKIKTTATWVPWTNSRLAVSSGYGAGVDSPGWYAHIWDGLQRAKAKRETGPAFDHVIHAARWQTRVASLLRAERQTADTASVIEAARLATALASVRGLAVPGLGEMQDATLATLCHGEPLRLKLIIERLVIGTDIGAIPDDVPQTPLQADLTRWQKRVKLKPGAMPEELSIDLRSENGLARSTLLHRLNLISVPWGRMTGAGSSRGTYRENWILEWKPELAVRLVEALIHGTTVEAAATGAALAGEKVHDLGRLSSLVQDCLNADLPEAASRLIARLQAEAAQTSGLEPLLTAVPPLAQVLRYGTARRVPVEPLTLLVKSLAVEVAVALVLGSQNLEEATARTLLSRITAFDRALDLLEDAALVSMWREALGKLHQVDAAAPLIRGWAVRRLYDCGDLDGDASETALLQALSPSVPPAAGASWLEGFLAGAGTVLLHDSRLMALIDTWLMSHGEEEFIGLLPALRRATNGFDKMERHRILDAVAKGQAGGGSTAFKGKISLSPQFAEALPLLALMLGNDAAPGDNS